MLPLLATPSPVPIIINMPESGSPWWAVPLITASAVLIGALITFLSVRASDARKSKRDTAERIMTDTRAVGLDFLDAVNSLSDLINAQQDPSRGLQHRSYLQSIQAAFFTMQSRWRKFELFAHDDALAKGSDLHAGCVSLLIDALGTGHPAASLKNVEVAKYALINTLRKASGVGEVKNEEPDPETKKKLDEDIAVVMDLVDENLAKRFNSPDLPATLP